MKALNISPYIFHFLVLTMGSTIVLPTDSTETSDALKRHSFIAQKHRIGSCSWPRQWMLSTHPLQANNF